MLDLCLTLAENSASELARRIAEFEGSVPLIEIRLDCLDVPCIPELPLNSSSQFLATCRPQRQGGQYEGAEADRLNLLAAASERRFNWIDLEYDVLEEVDLAEETSVVRSYHLFQDCPSDLDPIMTDLQTRGGDVFKIAVQVSTTSELKQLLLWMESLPEEISRVVIGMGVPGQPSRVLGKFLGNAWTYVAVSDDDPAAPGQFSLGAARRIYRIEQWKSTPDFYGVIGNPIENLSSVLIHNRLFEHYKREALFLPLQVDDLEPWFEYMGATRLRFNGLAVAPPFEKVVRSRVAASSGDMVRTLKREGRNWSGDGSAETDLAGSEDPESILTIAAEQFRIWTGIDPDRTRIREVLNAC